MNIITAYGRLTANAKASKTFKNSAGNDRAALRFTVASDRGFGEDAKTDFIPCVWFLKPDSKVIEYLVKGKEVIVVGSIQIQDYTTKDKESGEEVSRRSTDINVQTLRLVGGSRSNGNGDNQPSVPSDSGGDDDDLPF